MINMLGKLIAVIVALVWINQAQETTKSQLSNSFPVSEEFEYLLSIIKNQQDRFSEISRNVLKLQDDNEALQQSQQKQEEMINTQQLQIEAYRDDYQSLQNELQTTKMKLGTNYVRWGRTSCPDTAELIYEGMFLASVKPCKNHILLFHIRIEMSMYKSISKQGIPFKT